MMDFCTDLVASGAPGKAHVHSCVWLATGGFPSALPALGLIFNYGNTNKRKGLDEVVTWVCDERDPDNRINKSAVTSALPLSYAHHIRRHEAT